MHRIRDETVRYHDHHQIYIGRSGTAAAKQPEEQVPMGL